MIYLDAGATSLAKPESVYRAVLRAMRNCASPGRGAHAPSMEAARTVFRCREAAGKFFGCLPEQVVLTHNCTHGLNLAIRSLVAPGDRVVISGFEHNAVTRPLHALGARVEVAGRRLFDWEDTLKDFRRCLEKPAKAVIFTHVSNVFGYILPVEELSKLCRERQTPFVVDAAQSAGVLPVSLEGLGAAFIAAAGHKGLLGPQGTGVLLCGREGEPLLYGGTGGNSRSPDMPAFLPERLEAGTGNTPGAAGLDAGIRYLLSRGLDEIRLREESCRRLAAELLESLGFRVFTGEHQSGTLSFLPGMDCEEFSSLLARQGICLRAGFHCAPLAHESAGTLDTGTVRMSFGIDARPADVRRVFQVMSKLSAPEQ